MPHPHRHNHNYYQHHIRNHNRDHNHIPYMIHPPRYRQREICCCTIL